MTTLSIAQLELYADCRDNHVNAFEFVKKVFANFPDVAASIAGDALPPYIIKLENGPKYTIPGTVMSEVNKYLKRNEFVAAIKELRARTGLSLKDAREALDPIRGGWHP